MEKKRLEAICQQGEEAELLLKTGRVRDAFGMLQKITKDIEKSGDVDSYIAAKVTLGTLRCLVKLGDFKGAFKIWNTDEQGSLFAVGIAALESAQTTVKDMVAYDMLCAFLHTLADSEERDAATAVNQYLSRVCEQALEEGDRATMKIAVSNWKQHLRDIFRTSIPLDFAKPVIQFEKTLGETVKPQPIDFPAPTGWQKPEGFREMSTVMEMKNVGRPPGDARKKRTA